MLVYILSGLAIAFFICSICLIILNAKLRLRLNKTSAIGVLKIVESRDEEPYMFLELGTDVENIKSQKTVTLYVSHKIVPQK